MKRTAGAFVLLASLGGGCISSNPAGESISGTFGRVGHAKEIKGLQGPHGQPVAMGHNGQAYMPTGLPEHGPMPSTATGTGTLTHGVRPAHATKTEGGVVPAGYKTSTNLHDLPIDNLQQVNYGHRHPAHGTPIPKGAVAAVGALPEGMPTAALGGRTSVYFTATETTAGMKISWFGPGGTLIDTGLEAPVRYNFPQGGIYRLKLSQIPKKPGVDLYPTLEVRPATHESVAYLAHSSVPVSFTDDDLEQVLNGNFLVKVIYLPRKEFQDLAAGLPNELVSSRLEPGVDPVLEAERRGTVLLVIRMGNIDLELKHSPAMNTPPGSAAMGQPIMDQPIMGTPSGGSAPQKPNAGPTQAPPKPLPNSVSSKPSSPMSLLRR